MSNLSLVIPPNSNLPQSYFPNCTLLGMLSGSNTAQVNSVIIYDEINPSSITGLSKILYQGALGPGQVINMTFGADGIRCDKGLVVVPQGVTNADGGVSVVYRQGI